MTERSEDPVARFIDELKRSHHCGALRAADEGKEVVLFGWVASSRDHGGCVFVDLRDREGITQLVFDPDFTGHGDAPKKAYDLAQALRSEWVIGIRGVVIGRGANKNPRLATGEVEIRVVELTVFNKSETPPFEIADSIDTGEEKRLQYRYLDLRRSPLQQSLRTRHRINQVTRRYFDEAGFLELETPVMVKYTPGGARNFLVPSRMHQGKFYALAESPQLFKQLFMVAGFDRYFQIVKCFRDEDLRVDRQPEFTQIDVEMSFVNQDDIFRTIEGLVFKIWKEVLGIDLHEKYPSGRFPQMPFEESMGHYGNDKPDLRFAMPHTDVTDDVIAHNGGGIPFFAAIAEKFTSGKYRRDLPTEIVKALRVPADVAGKLSRAELDKLEEFVKGMGAKGLARAKVDGEGNWLQSPLAKTVTPEMRVAINARVGAKEGDLLFFQFGKESMVQTVMANLRIHLGKKLGLIPESGHGGSFNFPLGREPAALRVRRRQEHVGRSSPRLHAPPRRVRGHARYRSGQGALLPVRPRAQRLRGRRRQHSSARSARASEGLRGPRHQRRRGEAEVRLPPRRVEVRRASPRRRGPRDGPPRDAPLRRREPP